MPDGQKRHHPPLLAIASGKGGTGKSTVAVNLAFALSARGLAVGLVDLDLTGPDVPRLLNLRRTVTARHLDLWRLAPEPLRPARIMGLSVLSVGFFLTEDQALMMPGTLPELLVERFLYATWSGADLLVADLPPGTGGVVASVLRDTETLGLILVVTPDDLSHLDARKVITAAANCGTPVLGAVENFSGLLCPHCGATVPLLSTVRPKRSLWSEGIERLVSLTAHPGYAAAADLGHPVVAANPDGPLAKPFGSLADYILQAMGHHLA